MLINKLNKEPAHEVYLCLWLNFTEDGKHGCSKNCQFCNFRANPIYMCPEIADIKEFLNTYEKYARTKTVLLTGGGDPLYNFEKNQEKILEIIDTCEELGFSVIIQSGELDVIEKYYNSLFKNINMYYFSSEAQDKKLKQLANSLLAVNKLVVVSKVLNMSSKIDEINFDLVDNWINYYLACPGIQLLLHENYNCCFNKLENQQLNSRFKTKYHKYNVRYKPHSYAIDQFIGLCNNEVYWGQQFIFLTK